MATEIPLTRGLVALVDDADAEWLGQWKWRAKWCNSNFYAARTRALPGGRRRIVLMHREIAGAPKGVMVDHRDHNTMNNRRKNLRPCTNSQNQQNRKPRPGRLKGICRNGSGYMARIKVNGRNIHLGTFSTEQDGHNAYREAAMRYFGEFACVA